MFGIKFSIQKTCCVPKTKAQKILRNANSGGILHQSAFSFASKQHNKYSCGTTGQTVQQRALALLNCRQQNFFCGTSIFRRHFATAQRETRTIKRSDVDSSGGSVLEKLLVEETKHHVAKTRVEKAAQAGKDVWFFLVIAAGVAATASLFFLVGREFISARSPNRVYSRTAKLLRNDERVANVFGQPIKVYGEETRRGRRRHVTSLAFKTDGKDRLRMLFYVQGPMCKGTVQLEMHEDDIGAFDYRYLFVETEEMPPKVLVLIDNR